MINVIYDEEDNDYEVWLDTGVGERDGICLSFDKHEADALRKAQRELVEAQ